MKSCRGLILSVLLLTAVACPLSGSIAMGQIGFMPDASIGKEAQDFTLPTARGDSFNLKKAIAGKRAVIFFWATWCPYCRKELKKISGMTDKLKADQLVTIFVNVGESKAKVDQFLAANRYDFDIVLDEEQKLVADYPVDGIPTLFFVDESGKIKMVDHTLPNDYQRYF